MLVGAGGAGRALGFGAKSRGARVVIFDIDFGIKIRLMMSTMKFDFFPLIFSHVGAETLPTYQSQSILTSLYMIFLNQFPIT